MTVEAAPSRRTREDIAAAVISEVFAPIVVVPLVVLIVSLTSADSRADALGYALIAATLSAGLPYLALVLALRSGRIDDRHVRQRRQRPALMAVALVSVTAGLVLLVALHAPSRLSALVGAMVLGLGATLAISTRWKISMHTSCAAGAITSLAILVSPWLWLVLTAVSAAVAWSRVIHRHHTVGQVVAGGVLGVTAASVVLYPVLSA